tara:strand:- start:471 stop:746 length:276 start_codon:yes stop_codon:yes gene_type:complete
MKPHGYKRREQFAVGDLVQWNRWHISDERMNVVGRVIFKQYMHSHTGIVLEVYQSSRSMCWTAGVKFLDPILDSDWEHTRPIPLNCLVKLS